MDNKKIPTWLGVTIIIIFSLTLGVLVFNYQKEQELNTKSVLNIGSQSMPHPSSSIQQKDINNLKEVGSNSDISIDTWKSYTNKDDGYSIKYPSDWNYNFYDGVYYFVPGVKSDFYNIKDDSIKGDYAINVSIYRGIGNNKTLEEWTMNYKSTQNTVANVTIDGYPAIEFDSSYTSENLEKSLQYYFIDNNNNGYNIRVLYRDSRDYVGNRIISTMEFFNPTEDLNMYQNLSSEKQALGHIDAKKATPKFLVASIYNAIFKSKNNIDSEIKQDGCIYWKREDGINFGINGWKATSIRPDISSINADIEALRNFFADNGFAVNKDNTFINSKNDIMYVPGQSLGFEKGNLRCTISWSELTSDQNPRNSKKDYFNFACSEYSSQNEETYQTFLNMLGSGTMKYMCVEKRDGLFARGRSGGGIWYAKKVSNKWTVIWSGQDTSPCSSIVPNNFPSDVVGKCYDENTGKEKYL